MPTSYVVPALPLRRSVATLVLALVMIAAMSIFFVREVIDLRQTMGELRNNDTARIEVRNVMMNLLQAETGQRGFLLTGDKAYLVPYQLGRNSVRDSLQLAEESGFTDQEFLRNIRTLTLLTDSKLEEIERTVQLKKRGDDTAALNIVREGFGRQKMVEVRHVVQGEVNRLRVARDHTMGAFNDRLLRAAVILVLMLSTVVVMAFYAWRSLSAAARYNSDLARRLAVEASHDALTGLPNRRFFDRWARRLLARSQRAEKPFTLLAIDLDRFKGINDTLGHAVGDEVLKEVATRFQSVLRSGEFLARLGGDEFAVLMEGEFSRDEASSIGRRLIDALDAPLHPLVAGDALGASIGVAIFPRNGTVLESLVVAADDALYESKHRGRGVISFARAGVPHHPAPQHTSGQAHAMPRDAREACNAA